MFKNILSLIVISFVWTQMAKAQDSLVMFNAHNTAAINIASTIGLNAALKNQTKSAKKKKSKSPQSSEKLIYTQDSKISKQIKEEFKQAVQKADPAKADHIAKVLDGQNVLADFNKDMKPYGLTSTDMADTMTAYWIVMWMIGNKEGTPTLERVRAVREQVAQNMLGMASVTKMNDQDKQKVSEAFVYETMFALGQRADAQRRKDEERLYELAYHVQKNMRKNGVDIQNIKLTSDGFQQK